jgi:hypothetical protein
MPSQTYTVFSETPQSPEMIPSPLEDSEFDIPLMDTQCSLDSLSQEDPNPWSLPATTPSSAELKRRFDEYINPDYSNALDIDKSYVPQPRKRKAGSCRVYSPVRTLRIPLKYSSSRIYTPCSLELLCLLQSGRTISSYLFGTLYPAGLGN